MFQISEPLSIAHFLGYATVHVQKNSYGIETIWIPYETLQDLCPKHFKEGILSQFDEFNEECININKEIYEECVKTNLGRILNAAEKALKDKYVKGKRLYVNEKHM